PRQPRPPHVTPPYAPADSRLRPTPRASDELLRQGPRASVATLPPGEHPDTLVQKRGAAGLEAILKDAVDPLERKIQILDRKAFFSSLPGRRRALDRLLPTIRAAKDPITRELYLSRAAEAAGVRKDVLEREVTGDGGRGTRGATPSLVPRPSSPLPASAEKALLLLMLEGEPWCARVTEA